RYSPAAIAHPLDDGTAATLEESLDATCEQLGADGDSYRKFMAPFTNDPVAVFEEILRPIRFFPRHPFVLARFGLQGLRSAEAVVGRFRTAKARALFGGSAAHSFLPLDQRGSASFGIALMLAGHATGWPCARGGSYAIIEALASYYKSLGGETKTSHRVASLRDVPESRIVIFAVTPRQLAAIAEA